MCFVFLAVILVPELFKKLRETPRNNFHQVSSKSDPGCPCIFDHMFDQVFDPVFDQDQDSQDQNSQDQDHDSQDHNQDGQNQDPFFLDFLISSYIVLRFSHDPYL